MTTITYQDSTMKIKSSVSESSLSPDIIHSETLNTGTKFEINVSTDPTKYEGSGIYIDTTSGSLIRTSLTNNALKNNATSFDISMNSLTFGSTGSSAGQVITSNAQGRPSWQSIPTPTLSTILENNNSVGSTGINMNNQEITNVSTITATNVKPTTIVDVNNQSGSAGQVLSSTGTGIDWVTLSGGGGISSWIDTATSDLNMSGYNITSTGDISINPNTGANTLNLAGTVNVNSTLRINNGANALRVSGGLTNYNAIETTDMNNISGIEDRNQFFSVLLTGTTSTQTLTLPSVKNGYYMVLMNYSTQNWLIGKQAGEAFALGKGGTSAQGSPTTMTLPAGASFYLFSANPGTPTYFVVSETFPRKSLTNDSITSSNANGTNYLKTSSASANFTQSGTSSISSTSSTGGIVFPIAYTSNPVVVATLKSTTADKGNAVILVGISTTNFSWALNIAAQSGASIQWIAIGNATGVNQ